MIKHDVPESYNNPAIATGEPVASDDSISLRPWYSDARGRHPFECSPGRRELRFELGNPTQETSGSGPNGPRA